MNNWCKWVCCGFVAGVTLWAAQAAADAEVGQAYFSPMVTFIDDDKDRAVDDQVGGGTIALGGALHEYWNLELYAHYATLDGFAEQDHFEAGLDLQLVLNRAGRVSPYLLGGIGYMDVEPVGARHDDGGAWSAGAGLYLDVFGSSNTALRAEYRYRRDTALTDTLSDHLFSLGLQIPFGSGEPRIADADGDGVADSLDRCPGTPLGTAVDANGCSDGDGDGDGVADPADECPNTPAGTRVDNRGCELDSDGDGVGDGSDQCPDTVRGAPVDDVGCELDSDGDGVVDRRDQCPDTRAGAQVDFAGCEIKDEIRLPGVRFETNSDRLVPGTEAVLDNAAATLKQNPSISVEVAGHTDSDGAAEYNEGLSERRAIAVRNYLAASGIDPERMTVRGYGESQPIADNGTREGKAQNRRVALRITER